MVYLVRSPPGGGRYSVATSSEERARQLECDYDYIRVTRWQYYLFRAGLTNAPTEYWEPGASLDDYE